MFANNIKIVMLKEYKLDKKSLSMMHHNVYLLKKITFIN